MHLVVLTGGVGGARFLRGVRAHARRIGAEVTAVVNTGDDISLHGLRVCPDLDSVMYTLGGGADPARGWGRADETWTVRDELAAYGAQPDWFGLGDRDLATHLVRSTMLTAGYPLSAVTEALCHRWRPGVRLLPATDDRLETHVVVAADRAGGQGAGDGLGTAGSGGTAGEDPADQDTAGGRVQGEGAASEGTGGGGTEAIHFQEWWVRHRAKLPAERFVFVGAESARPAPGVTEAVADADAILLAPSNPVVSIAPILAVPGLREAVVGGSAPVVGVSPIIGGAPVRGMADACLAVIGVECSAAGVGRMYGARGAGGLLDGWLVDAGADAGTEVPGVAVRAVPLWMTDDDATAAIVAAALEAVGG
jgi:LPPG:FO 2-phospho-L-lactate transferase